MVLRLLCKRLWILLMLLVLPLTGCGTSSEEVSDAADSANEKKQTLQDELDALVLQLAFEDTEMTLPDLSQDADTANFPAELVQQLHEALVAGTSDALLRELDDASLRINREDFDYMPREGEELSRQEEKINTLLAN